MSTRYNWVSFYNKCHGSHSIRLMKEKQCLGYNQFFKSEHFHTVCIDILLHNDAEARARARMKNLCPYLHNSSTYVIRTECTQPVQITTPQSNNNEIKQSKQSDECSQNARGGLQEHDKTLTSVTRVSFSSAGKCKLKWTSCCWECRDRVGHSDNVEHFPFYTHISSDCDTSTGLQTDPRHTHTQA